MALVRCERCGKPSGRGRVYVASRPPLGYPADAAAICGRAGCDRPGLLWLDGDEAREYQEGERVFQLPTAAAKIRVQ